jgi:hypothetical protein
MILAVSWFKFSSGVIYFALFEEDKAVASVAGTPMTQQVRGRLYKEGGWRFETLAGVLQVRPTDQADCELSIQGLSALIYGTHDPGDFSIRGWGDPAEGLLEIMRTMFPAMLPHLHEYF